MDTVYPEPTSILYRRPVRKKIRGHITRYRTQPITFAEIKEVDEENIDDSINETRKPRSEIDLNRRFEEFKRQRDLMLSTIDNELASPESSPIMSPVKDSMTDKYHPIEYALHSTFKVPNPSKATEAIAPPGKKITSRPSL